VRGRPHLSNDCSFIRGLAFAQFTAPVTGAAAAADTVHKLALDHGWQSGEPSHDTGDPSYWVSGGVVHLSGSMLQPSGTSQLFAVLPKADRPAHYLYLKVMVYTPDNSAHAGTVQIDPDGAMYAYSPIAGDAQKYTSLAGVSFPLGS
jgi:hypothetical protein